MVETAVCQGLHPPPPGTGDKSFCTLLTCLGHWIVRNQGLSAQMSTLIPGLGVTWKGPHSQFLAEG